MKNEKDDWGKIYKRIRDLQKEKLPEGSTLIHCFSCANYKDCDSCKTLWNKVDCFIGFLEEEGSIIVSNGTERMGIVRRIVEVLENE